MQPIPLKPEIFCLDRTLINVLLERHPTFDIFWYHWPTDGIFFWIEDYEPVIISYYSDDTVCSVIVRKAWDFVTTPIDELIIPLRILFDSMQHHPTVLTSRKNYLGIASLAKLPYNEVPITSGQIPPMYRTGKSHPSNVSISSLNSPLREDPADYAHTRHKEFCQTLP
jgi:hypothetical protein